MRFTYGFNGGRITRRSVAKQSFKIQRDILQTTVEDILNREGLNSICDINLKVLNGISDNISKQGQNELVGALLQYIKCTNRFRQV